MAFLDVFRSLTRIDSRLMGARRRYHEPRLAPEHRPWKPLPVIFKRLLSVAGAMALTIGVSACHGDDAAHTTAEPPVPVTVTQVHKHPWADVIQALGTAQATDSVTVTAKVTETVRKVNFKDGQHVDAGDVLVELTKNQQTASLEDAQAAYKQAKGNYARAADLVKRGLVARSAYDQALANRDSALAKVQGIRAQLSDRVITAPFSGRLGLRQVSPGTLVTPGTPITTLDDLSVMHVDFSVPETQMGALRAGLKVVAHSPAYPDSDFAGSVESVDTRIDPATRAVTVRARVPNKDDLLRPGMLLNIELTARKRQALAVPELALVPIGTQHYVYRVGPDRIARQIKVETGARRGRYVEITGGLQAGERIVVEGTVNLREGARVAIQGDHPVQAGSGQAASQ